VSASQQYFYVSVRQTALTHATKLTQGSTMSQFVLFKRFKAKHKMLKLLSTNQPPQSVLTSDIGT
jgi:hypothetical protein